MLNERILNSVGRQNYGMYMLLTNGKEIDKILNNRSPIFELYKYRDKLLDEEVGQNVTSDELEEFLQNDDDIGLKKQLENLFLESISKSTFEIVKNMLTNNTFGWNISRLVAIHKKHKGYRIFRIVSIEYENWINHQPVRLNETIINRNQLGKKIGCILGSDGDIKRNNYKNIVFGYINNEMILLRTNLTQIQFNKFCKGKLSNEELDKCI